MKKLLHEIASCTACAAHLPSGPRPIVAAHKDSKIVVIGQAPGAVVHRTGIPWDDKSGANLRAWMDVSDAVFYDPKQIALLPMGFCYPGKGASGDLPPRKECAPLWHDSILQQMKKVRLILLIGGYAQNYYLPNNNEKTLTATVKKYSEYLPQYFVLPHPSPRNNIWIAKNEWFKTDVLPQLKKEVKKALLSL